MNDEKMLTNLLSEIEAAFRLVAAKADELACSIDGQVAEGIIELRRDKKVLDALCERAERMAPTMRESERLLARALSKLGSARIAVTTKWRAVEGV